MTALREVSAYLPPDRVDIGSLQSRLGLTDAEIKVYRRVFGLREVRHGLDALPGDLLLSAIGGLTSPAGVRERVRYIVQARTMPEVSPYPHSPLDGILAKGEFPNAVPFALTEQACASGLFAVDVCGRLLAEDGDPDGLALVLVGEKAFTQAALQVPGASVNGEAAAAVLVGADGDRDVLLGYATRTYGRFYEFQSRDKESVLEFQRIYAEALGEVLRGAAEQAGTDLSGIALVLPHNVNRISWTRIAKHLGIPLDRLFLDNMALTGHSFCADPFVNLVSARRSGRLRPGDLYLMATVGLGATFSAMAFRH
ncbi:MULTISPECIES: 3-oxoacyl-[acyl-carrier-protein] synthase III C-terminal domain-containing protein [unclassified Streptomyces]|uniref:3-oxoacyl-[acyl-carrier-protein] synthase III C-terminal domain-containing protein n=1 Tax=unclassified Streptomyces TaxID=2593676 RepID=UPI000DACF05E|nr:MULTISPECIES: 3-oxoacyl-[acyl-carrier-protein] synthase III C-terminal domain-containing protein [unclassified Streptomyces]PZT77067.1 3-oxoacyl-ACP synthase [Streptomyces sp. AC1-42W]PZT78980.1 3-oxoacyl-ACP synthase [Streptomyces sp. AC1-42T]